MPRSYELMLVVTIKGSAESQEKRIAEIKKQIESLGKIEKVTNLGKKTLTYPIKKEKEGSYFLLEIQLTGKEVNKLNEYLKLTEFVLRHLIVRRK